MIRRISWSFDTESANLRTVVRLAILACMGCTPFAATTHADETRAPNEFERAYTAMAIDLDAHDLCTKISANAQEKNWFNSRGTQSYKERSRCFLYVAVNTLNPYLCRYVVEHSDWLHNGSYYSLDNCRELVAAGRPFNFSLSFNRALIMRHMGYRDSDVAERFPGLQGEHAWHRFYLDVRKRGGGLFQQRLTKLPDFSN